MRAPIAAFFAAATLALALLPTLAAEQEPDPPPLTASVVFLPGQSDGVRVRGQLAISLVNVTADVVRDVSVRLEQPIGAAATQEPAIVGDVEGEGTGIASIEVAVDQAFLVSSAPYVLRLGFSDGTGARSEALTTVHRQAGGGR